MATPPQPSAMATHPKTPTTTTTTTTTSSANAFSLLSNAWRHDIQLMRDRATSFRNLAISFDPPPPPQNPADMDFVRNLRLRLPATSEGSGARRIQKWRLPPPTATAMCSSRIRMGLVNIKDAIVAEVEDTDGIWGFEGDNSKREEKDWEPIQKLKTKFKEFEKNNEFVEKFKSSLKLIYKEPEESKEVPPLDVPELLAYFVKQSSPFLDQLGVRRDFRDKIVESLYSKSKNQLVLRSLSSGESSIIGNGNVNDELDLRIASVLQSTGHRYNGEPWTDHTKHDPSENKRHLAIVTTTSLPWMTGTSVNPLFRAAYLSKSANQKITLMVPWLCTSDQQLVYPDNITFSLPEQQEVYIHNWLEERIGFKADFKICFYPGKFSKERRSIIPAGDTSQFIPSRDADIAILEEPEHLNWYHHGRRWTDKFNHVVGVVHTNYLEYIKREKNGPLQAFLVKHINNLVTRAHCHKVLRLSAATQDLPRSVICNVHGVNPKFLKIGEKIAADKELGQKAFTKGAYFLGKMVWAKGYKELIDLLAKHKSDLDGFKLDVFGNGEDANEVQSMAKRFDLNINFQKGRDHADDSLHGYKVFINPSISDVLCTATAEALAMGKFVVCADHPSNEFFRTFPNCLTYKTSEDFVAKVKEALENEPQLLSPEQRYQLSWDAATQRFLEYSELDRVLNTQDDTANSKTHNGQKRIAKSVSMPNLTEMVDGGIAFAHYCFNGSEFLRLCTGALPGTRNYDKQQAQDLHLLPPQVQNPIYGW
ncbi:digalactosyldiacylglycerol synthase 1, chloroplastic-like [Arachis hypogaea]|uniref:digalactosyldiacylglycerol synthase 1, chloroplastic-like n=1 Tax=Arachis hypogaea TaxID=3818 RepID=UPI000DED2536|nr:digalactosyldiacylglycerol synthase 1, chloroplastic-like isoform X1 [Arachis hypogaea]XP_025662136.1 digalactosyldiacylglycerol synthase 1, chloroplastic-like [Arachis hypogaea]QHO25872.1 Digalactosyldiacylglycerol synthase 1 [Arachis hypogaea]